MIAFVYPFRNTAAHVIHFSKAVIHKNFSRCSTSASGFTINNNRLVCGQFIQPAFQRVHRYQSDTFYMGFIVFILVSNIKNKIILAFCYYLVNFLNRNKSSYSNISSRSFFFCLFGRITFFYPLINAPSRHVIDIAESIFQQGLCGSFTSSAS